MKILKDELDYDLQKIDVDEAEKKGRQKKGKH